MDDQADLESAVAAFAWVYPIAAGLVPEPIRAIFSPVVYDSGTEAAGDDAARLSLAAVALRFARHVYRDLRDGVEPALAVHNGVHHLRSRYPQHPYAWASHIHFGP